MKILAFSDLHRDAAMADAIVSQSGDFDVVVGAGDFATCGLGLQDTIAILRRMPVPFVLVPGNHDDLEELRTVCADWRLAHVLHGQSAVVNGVPFFGIGYGSGVVNPEPWNRALDEAEATQMLSQCPAHAVLVSHSPPHGIADRQRDGRHDGSMAVRDAILLHQPRLTICGHIHNGWGQSGKNRPYADPQYWSQASCLHGLTWRGVPLIPARDRERRLDQAPTYPSAVCRSARTRRSGYRRADTSSRRCVRISA